MQFLLNFIDNCQNPHYLCLISYRLPLNFTPVISAHGNSKSKRPFFPTLPSTKIDLTEQCQSQGPKAAVRIVSKKLGGVVGSKSPCELPRNERQATYLKSKCTNSQFSNDKSFTDDVFVLMQRAKEKDDLGLFVRETRTSPEPAFVLARDRQLDDLVQYCTPNENFSILTVDPTFNLGAFDVTPITYKHDKYKNRETTCVYRSSVNTLPQDISFVFVFCCHHHRTSSKVTSS